MSKLNTTYGTYAKVFVENTDEAWLERQKCKSICETKLLVQPANSNKLKKNYLFE